MLTPKQPLKKPVQKIISSNNSVKRVKQEDLWAKQHQIMCKQEEYYDLKNKKLKLEITLLQMEIDKQEASSSMCDLLGLEH